MVGDNETKKQHAALSKKQSESLRLSHRVQDLAVEAVNRAEELRKQKSKHTQNVISQIRIQEHIQQVKNDQVLRMSDKSQNIRTLGKMDVDVWKYEAVREWFNPKCQDAPGSKYSITAGIDSGAWRGCSTSEGYLIKKD